MSMLYCIAFHTDTKIYPVKFEYQWPRTGTILLFTHIKHCAGAVGWEGLVNLNPFLSPKYLLPSQLILVLAPSYLLLLRSKYLFTPHQSEIQTPIWYVMLHLQSAWYSFAVLQKPCWPKSPFVCVNRSNIWCGFHACPVQQLSSTVST